MSSRLKNNRYLVSNLHRPLREMRYCSASLWDTCGGRCTKKAIPSCLAQCPDFRDPAPSLAWDRVWSLPKQHLQMKNMPLTLN